MPSIKEYPCAKLTVSGNAKTLINLDSSIGCRISAQDIPAPSTLLSEPYHLPDGSYGRQQPPSDNI